MQKPDLNQMWEIFIKIGLKVPLVRFFNMIRFKVYPVISCLKDSGINWYCFLIHDRTTGVPTTEDDDNAYFHIRFAFRKNIKIRDKKDVNKFLPDYCEKHMTRPCKGIESISGIDKSLLKNEEIEEAWRMIGEQSEWLLNMLNIYKERIEIAPQQVLQFLHYYANMAQMEVRF